MSISPLDVRNQVFKKKLRGFDADEVRIFLDAVADRMEDMIKQRETLERENAALREQNSSYADMESALRDTMVTAQRICDESKANAQREAAMIIKQAELEAQAKVADVDRQVKNLSRNRDSTRVETIAFVTKLRSLLEGHLSFLGSIESEVRSDKGVEGKRVGVYEDVGS